MCVSKKIRGFSLAMRHTLAKLLLYLMNLKLGIKKIMAARKRESEKQRESKVS